MPSMVQKNCKQCGKKYFRRAAYVKAVGAKFCGKKCFGLSRRSGLTKEEKVRRKAAYDAAYREKNRKRLCAEKRANYRKNHAYYLAKMAERRANGTQRRYMRKYLKTYMTAERKKDKAAYDRVWRAKKKFGPYWEAHLLILKINKEVLKRASKYECRLARGYYNKAQIRKRQWLRNNLTLAP